MSGLLQGFRSVYLSVSVQDQDHDWGVGGVGGFTISCSFCERVQGVLCLCFGLCFWALLCLWDLLWLLWLLLSESLAAAVILEGNLMVGMVCELG